MAKLVPLSQVPYRARKYEADAMASQLTHMPDHTSHHRIAFQVMEGV